MKGILNNKYQVVFDLNHLCSDPLFNSALKTFVFNIPVGVGFNWSFESLNKQIKVSKTICLYTSESQQILSLAIWNDLVSEAELLFLYVPEEKRGQGYGKAILKNLFQSYQSKNWYLEVFDKNQAAISLYKSLGFKELSIRKNYYGPQKNAFIMGKFS